MTILKVNSTSLLIFLTLIFSIYFLGILNIPVLDRDEARFASASKNMIESRDYIDIKLDGETRYKKPIGIYWAQVISTKIFGEPPYDKIWTYRIPSFLGIFLSLILIFFVTSNLFDKNVGFLSTFLMSLSFLTVTEINQAKSDGLLFLFINICNLIVLNFAHLLEKKKQTRKFKSLKLLFWISLAFGILIKGPIILLFVILPTLVFSTFKKDYSLFKMLNFFPGHIIFLLICLPWFVIITIKSGGMFWQESVINDLLKKVSTGQESHGFYPGYYSLLLFLFLWPSCTFIFPALKHFMSNKNKLVNNAKYLYLFCWFFVPFIIYELIVTKLPHYVLPSYTALVILISSFLVENLNLKRKLFNFTTYICSLIFPIVILSVYIAAIVTYSKINYLTYILVAFLIILILFITISLIKRKVINFLFFAATFQCLLYLIIVYDLKPHLKKFWISDNINQIIKNEINDVDNIYSFGFNEPSLVFVAGKKLTKIEPKKMLEKASNSKRNLFIITEEKSQDFINQNHNKLHIEKIRTFSGFNYSQGKNINFVVFKN